MSDLNIELALFSELNEIMKRVVQASERINTIALNAMFMSRKSLQGNSGFSEVTALLRKFSASLNLQMSHMTLIVNQMLVCAAQYKKFKHYDYLLEYGLKNAQLDYFVENNRTRQHVNALAGELEEYITVFQRQLKKACILIGNGENMVVLAKIEAKNSGVTAQLVDALTLELENTVNQITHHVNNFKSLLVA